MTTSTEPTSHAQKPAAASRGKASDRAPSCSGTTAMATPTSSGSTTTNVRPTRYSENSCGIELTSSIVACGVDPFDAEQDRSDDDDAEQADERHTDEQATDPLVVGRGQPVDHRTPSPAPDARVPAPVACVSMVVMGSELFRFGTRTRSARSVTGRFAVGLHGEITHRRHAGGNPQTPERTSTSMVIAPNSRVT